MPPASKNNINMKSVNGTPPNTIQLPQMQALPQAPLMPPQQPNPNNDTEKQLVAFLKEMEQKVEDLSHRVEDLEGAEKEPQEGKVQPESNAQPQGSEGLMQGIFNQVMGQKLISKLESQNPEPKS